MHITSLTSMTSNSKKKLSFAWVKPNKIQVNMDGTLHNVHVKKLKSSSVKLSPNLYGVVFTHTFSNQKLRKDCCLILDRRQSNKQRVEKMVQVLYGLYLQLGTYSFQHVHRHIRSKQIKKLFYVLCYGTTDMSLPFKKRLYVRKKIL